MGTWLTLRAGFSAQAVVVHTDSRDAPQNSLSLVARLHPGVFLPLLPAPRRCWVTAHPVFTLQGYRQKDSYIASQGPLQHTIEDFWRMIWEWKSCSIVMLTELEERGQVSARGSCTGAPAEQVSVTP